ncbi:hypothetical protein SAMN04488037_11184 [Shimia marina]|uniref:Uncharacterized protein n=1 Tax=Shimia marina TaxID=321267 RepID=A0A0P1F889_9RHOB|nr:hypothetical protein SHM7688_00329 [Shimia marina]SFE56276.1 hypothetical protein SAMN04488037_11184 [Shimia marina]
MSVTRRYSHGIATVEFRAFAAQPCVYDVYTKAPASAEALRNEPYRGSWLGRIPGVVQIRLNF